MLVFTEASEMNDGAPVSQTTSFVLPLCLKRVSGSGSDYDRNL